MSFTNAKWKAALLSRFTDREDIGKDGVYTQYFLKEDLPKEEVLECLSLIEEECKVSAGLLRPWDELDKLFEPVATNNPLRWLVYQIRAGDRQNEISYQLAKKQRQHGTYGIWSRVETIDELVRSWCGRKPQ